MLHYAQTLMEIGDLYYEGRNSQNNLARMDRCLDLTSKIRDELENAKLRLDDKEAFKEELVILQRYTEVFERQIIAAGGNIPATNTGPNPPVTPDPRMPPADMAALQTRVNSLFREIALSFPETSEVPIAAIASFALRDGSEPPLVSYLNQSAITVLAGNPRLLLVERERLDLIRSEHAFQNVELLDADAAIRLGRLLGARYIITGQIIPMSAQVIVFGRVINVETGEILSAAQIFLDREMLGGLI
jgi:TolB-like protein